jgi:hypothetical protein
MANGRILMEGSSEGEAGTLSRGCDDGWRTLNALRQLRVAYPLRSWFLQRVGSSSLFSSWKEITKDRSSEALLLLRSSTSCSRASHADVGSTAPPRGLRACTGVSPRASCSTSYRRENFRAGALPEKHKSKIAIASISRFVRVPSCWEFCLRRVFLSEELGNATKATDGDAIDNNRAVN